MRSRQSKRKNERVPGVWRGTSRTGTRTSEREAVEHGIRGQVGVSWRTVSGLIVLILAAILIMFFIAQVFYVRRIVVVGANYLDESEIFRYANIAQMHIFWIDPAQVRQNILDASPVVADAQVDVGWPPNMVKIFIEEREAALIWSQAGVTALIDLRGRILRYPPNGEILPELLEVIADNSADGPPGLESPIDVDAINAALQLRTLLVGIPNLRYNVKKGLGFRESGWDVWLGTGTDMHNKLLIYEQLRDNLTNQGIVPTEINVADLNGIYILLSEL